MYLFNNDKVCPVCGKQFWAPSEEWAYKRRKTKTGSFYYFCSWKHLREYEQKTERPRKVSTSATGQGDEIMRMVREGYKNVEICRELGVASGTVSYYKGKLKETEWLKEIKEDQG